MSKTINIREYINKNTYFNRDTYMFDIIEGVEDLELGESNFEIADDYKFNIGSNEKSSIGFDYISSSTYRNILELCIAGLLCNKNNIKSSYSLFCKAKITHIPTNNCRYIKECLFKLVNSSDFKFVNILNSKGDLIMSIDGVCCKKTNICTEIINKKDKEIIDFIESIQPYLSTTIDNCVGSLITKDFLVQQEYIDYISNIKKEFNVFSKVFVENIFVNDCNNNGYSKIHSNISISNGYYTLIHELAHALDLQNKKDNIIQDAKEEINMIFANSSESDKIKKKCSNLKNGWLIQKYYLNPSEIFARVITMYFKYKNGEVEDNKTNLLYVSNKTVNECSDAIERILEHINT